MTWVKGTRDNMVTPQKAEAVIHPTSPAPPRTIVDGERTQCQRWDISKPTRKHHKQRRLAFFI
jgi:hypothetical protein